MADDQERSSGIPQRSQADYKASKYILHGRKLCVVLIHDERQKIDDSWMKEKSKSRIKNDLRQLENTLCSKFGNVIIEKIPINKGLTTKTFKEHLKTFADDIKSDVGAFLCCFLGFGGSQYVYLGNSEKMDFAEVVQQFNGENCKALVMKPKLFFVQAEAIVPARPSDGSFSGTESKGDLVKIPIHADIFVYFSSELAGDLWNEVPLPDGGGVMSRFVNLLCCEIEALTPETPDVDIQKMVIRINSKIHTADFPNQFNPPQDVDLLPLATSQLTKDLFLADLTQTSTWE